MVSKEIIDLMNPNITQLNPFKAGEQLGNEYLKLNANENMYSISKKMKKKLFKKLFNLEPNLYPDESSLNVRKTIEQKYEIDKNKVLIDNGSTAILSLIFRLFFTQNDKVDFLVPTYPLYYTLAKIQGATINEIKYGSFEKLPYDKITKSDSKMLILVNPNAPTGTKVEIKDVEKLLKVCKNKIVLIDEAYADFSNATSLKLLNKYKNLIVVKSFSKAQALAGVRLGCCFANEKIIENLNKIRNVNNLSIYSQEIAIFTMENDFYSNNIEKINKNREWFLKKLKKLDFKTIKSYTNFILVKPPLYSDDEFYKKLKENKVLVRLLDTNTPCNIRISIGKKKDMKKILEVIKKILKEKV